LNEFLPDFEFLWWASARVFLVQRAAVHPLDAGNLCTQKIISQIASADTDVLKNRNLKNAASRH
jgi:hypothetical protein